MLVHLIKDKIMPTGTFYGVDTFDGPKLIKIQSTLRITEGSQLIPVGLDFAIGSIIPGMLVTGEGVQEGTMVLEAVNGVVLVDKPFTASYICSGITLLGDDTTGLGIGTMEIGSSFVIA